MNRRPLGALLALLLAAPGSAGGQRALARAPQARAPLGAAPAPPRPAGALVPQLPQRALQALAAAALAAPAVQIGASSGAEPRAPRVAVIGGGIAGLAAAHELARLGVAARIYDADTRLGGRVRTVRDARTGLLFEEGAEFVSSTHHDLLALMSELGVGTARRRSARLRKSVVYRGRALDEAAFQRRLFRQARPQLRAIARDARRVREAAKNGDVPTLRRFDEATIGEYLDGIRAPPILRALVKMVVDSEAGRDHRALSAVVLFECLEIDLDGERVHALPDEDEAFKVKGGAGRIVGELAARHAGAAELEHRLTSLESEDGRRFRLTFQTPQGPRVAWADYVIMTLPMPALRDVEIRAPGWTAERRRKVEASRSGSHLKVSLDFSERLWRRQGHSGSGLTEQGLAFWDSSEGQRTKRGSVTFLGRADALRAKTPEALARALLAQLERAVPGVSKRYLGFRHRAWESSYPFADGPGYPYGYVLTFLGRLSPGKVDSTPLGRLVWAGDIFSLVSPAYMNGAVETALRAARAVQAMILGDAPDDGRRAAAALRPGRGFAFAFA